MNIQPDIKHDSVGNDDGSHGGEDFVLTGDYAWISVGNYSIRINKTDLKTKIGIWERDREDEEPIDKIVLYNE